MKRKIISPRFTSQKGSTPHLERNPQIDTIALVKKKIQSGEYNFVHQKCFCGGDNDILISEVDRYELPINSVICIDCGSIRIDPYLDKLSTIDFYTHYYQRMYNRASDKNAYFEKQAQYGRKVIKLVNDLGFPVHRVLELGCGAGGALFEFKKQGIEVFGCEFDAELIEFGKSKGVLNIITGSVEDLVNQLGSLKFDLIFSHHVMEHVGEIELFFDAGMKLLSESGNMIHVVPDIFSLSSKHSNGGNLLSMIHIAHKFNFSEQGLREIALKKKLAFNILYPAESLHTHMTGSPEIWAHFSFKTKENVKTPFDFGELFSRLNRIEVSFRSNQQKRFVKKQLSRIKKILISPMKKLKSLSYFFIKRNTVETREPYIVPLAGYDENRLSIPYVNYLGNDDLAHLNEMLDWKAFVVDSSGRRFGNIAWAGKRTTPQAIPDPRHVLLNDRILLRDKTVLEIGCFEGIHTISLCKLAKGVIAIDSRIENVVKTLVRTGFFNVRPTVFKCDVEKWDTPKDWLMADVCHHIGVLYHLKDPVTHLRFLSTIITDAIFLDTHIAVPTDKLEEYEVEGRMFKYRKYLEGGKTDVFSGMYDHSKWLLLDDIKNVLSECGFSKIEVIQERAERNGPRTLLLAQR